MIDAFMQGMQELDFVEGRDFKFAYRSAEGHLDRLPSLAEEVVNLKPDVILATVTPAVVSVRALTKTVPIVCPFLADPIQLGLIASMSHPGGNVTGVLFRTEGLVGKQLQLALQLIPSARKIGFLVNVAGPVVVDREELETASRNAGVSLVTAEVREPGDLDTAFHSLAISTFRQSSCKSMECSSTKENGLLRLLQQRGCPLSMASGTMSMQAV